MTHTHKGFTLIEIMIGMVIIGLIMAIAIPNVQGYLARAKKGTTYSNLKVLKNIILQYNADTNRYPKKLSDLVKKPRDEDVARRWEGPYLTDGEIPTDGWGNQFKYSQKQDKNNPYTLYSYGPNGPGSPKKEHLSVWDKV